MDEKQQQFAQTLAGLALLVLQAVFQGKILFDSTPTDHPDFQQAHEGMQNASAGLARMLQAAQQ